LGYGIVNGVHTENKRGVRSSLLLISDYSMVSSLAIGHLHNNADLGHISGMKTVTLRTARAKLDSLLQLVAAGEEIEIVEKRKPVARLIPPPAVEVDWSGTVAKLDEVWGNKPLPGKPGSAIVSEGRR
jgi:prevent-host-death family protein